MSSANFRSNGAFEGTSARKLSPAPRPQRSGQRPERTPLALVRVLPRRRSILFGVSCLAALGAALLGVLLLNIQVSQGQYEMVALKSQQSDLGKARQELNQQLQDFQAPQNLAYKAGQFGMVPAAGQGQIDARTLKVSGEPKVAGEKGSDKQAVIAPPAVAGSLSVVPNLTVDNTPVTTGEQADPPKETKATEPNPAPAREPAVELNGGSVPAPAQRTPGN